MREFFDIPDDNVHIIDLSLKPKEKKPRKPRSPNKSPVYLTGKKAGQTRKAMEDKDKQKAYRDRKRNKQ